MKFKNLEQYRTGGTSSQMELSIPLPRTPEGRVYRFSPNETAHPRHFVLGEYDRALQITPEARARMKLEPRSSGRVCPYSGVIGEEQAFTHPVDREAGLALVKHAALEDIKAELGRVMDGIARSSRALKVKRGSGSGPRPKPRFARYDLLRELVCDHCGRDYGVFAIGLFCPDCGAPNVRLHFAREVELVEAQVAMAEKAGADSRELAYRLLGNAHEDVLTAFEATLKTVYKHGAQEAGLNPKPVKNDFQNIERAERRFVELNLNPFSILTAAQLSVLELNIQKRHIIGHNLGVVDNRFAEHAQDAKVGETVALVADDIRAFAALACKVVESLDAWLGGSPIPGNLSAPSRSDIELERQAEPVILPNSRLSPLAQRLGAWLSEQSSDGMAWPVDETKLLVAFNDVEQRQLEDAIAELEIEGLVSSSRVLGSTLQRFRLTIDLFATFDPAVHGADPTLDAGNLARQALEGDTSVDVAALHASTGWTKRRFNPAVGILVAQIDQRRVSRSGDGEYPTRFFHLLAEDRVNLRRFADRVGA